MKCKKCHCYPTYKQDLCKACFKRQFFSCENCNEDTGFNSVYIKKHLICSTCLISYLNVEEIFKDGVINEWANEIKNKKIENIYSNYKNFRLISIFFLIISICLLGYAIMTKDVDDFFISFIIISIFITTVFFIKLFNYKKNLSNKVNSVKKSFVNILLSNKFNQYGIPAKLCITEIIDFGEYAKENYNGNINKISDEDIAYLANEKKITFTVAKSYIEYYKRISTEFSSILKKIIYEQNYDKELEEYYDTLEKYEDIVNNGKYIEYDEYYNEIITYLSDKLSANKYYNQLHIKKEKIEILPYKNIKLMLKLEMPEIFVLNKPTEIKGMIKVNLFEKDELVAEGYINGNFKNNNKYKIICKAVKDIKDLKKVIIKYELIVLWLP